MNPNLLLYKASAAHNLPVMCHAMALCAQKNWTNENDLKRSALHQAVLSVNKLIFFIKLPLNNQTNINFNLAGLGNGMRIFITEWVSY